MEELKIPNHVGIILDGNGRWATEKNKKRSEGHKAGYNNLKKLSIYILNQGVKYLSIYVFSTENFKRSEEEVGYLMGLFVKAFRSEMDFFVKNNVKVLVSGRRDKLNKDVLKAIEELTETSKNCTGGTFNICLNYGAQAEIVDACKKIAKLYKEDNIDLDKLDEKEFYKYLYNDLPPVDLLIRTSGEIRVSNYMLYSIAYAELYFTDVCFPDFTEEEFDKALLSYQSRNITKGGVKYN